MADELRFLSLMTLQEKVIRLFKKTIGLIREHVIALKAQLCWSRPGTRIAIRTPGHLNMPKGLGLPCRDADVHARGTGPI